MWLWPGGCSPLQPESDAGDDQVPFSVTRGKQDKPTEGVGSGVDWMGKGKWMGTWRGGAFHILRGSHVARVRGTERCRQTEDAIGREKFCTQAHTLFRHHVQSLSFMQLRVGHSRSPQI